MADGRFQLRQDDSCHWYVVPVEQGDAFAAWSEGGYEDSPDPPEGCEQVGGWPGLVTFTDPRFE